MSYTLTTKKTWAQTRDMLAETFEKWGVADWNIIPPDGLKPSQYTNGFYYNPSQRAVTVRWTTRQEKREIRLSMSEQTRPVDNLRVLALATEAMRMNEVRGIGRTIQDAYMQLAAPLAARDPYEVLQVRPDAAMEVIEAVYKSLAKKAHPDMGGSTAQMTELNDAIERIRQERGAS